MRSVLTWTGRRVGVQPGRPRIGKLQLADRK